MTQEQLEQLIIDRVLTESEEDRGRAVKELRLAERHIRTAEKAIEEDPTLAFVTFYDAMRKAISAHMRWHGVRVNKPTSTHIKVGQYASVALDHLGATDHISEFEYLRKLRNQAEYDAVEVDKAEARSARDHAKAIVGAVLTDLNL